MNNNKEIWRDIEGFEGFYQVSDRGNVRSIDRVITTKTGNMYFMKGKIRSLSKDKDGYKQIVLTKNGEFKCFRVSRLVALAFIPNPDNLPEVNHKDENIENNSVENLEWVTKLDNYFYGTRIERIGKAKRKKINQYSKDGEFIRSFESIKEASEITSVTASNISACCRGERNYAGGYKWSFVA